MSSVPTPDHVRTDQRLSPAAGQLPSDPDEPLPPLPQAPGQPDPLVELASGTPVDLDLSFDGAGQGAEQPLPALSEAALMPASPTEDVWPPSEPLPMPVVYAETPAAAAPSADGWSRHRVLVVSHDLQERMYLRAKLALSRVVWVDEFTTTAKALAAMDARPYMIAVVNLDSVSLDGYGIAQRFLQGNPAGALVLTTAAFTGAHPLNLLAGWRRRQLRAHMGALRHTTVLSKPLDPRQVAEWLVRFLATHPG